MRYFYSAGVLSLFSSLFCTAQESTPTLPLLHHETVVYQGRTMQVIVPPQPLALGSLRIVPTSGMRHLSAWQMAHHKEAYDLIQLIIQVWQSRGIQDYLIYGKESLDSPAPFSWEIVPFPKEGWKFWKQFKVLWNITFKSLSPSSAALQRVSTDFVEAQELIGESELEEDSLESVKGDDAFCKQEVIDNQWVYQGKEVNVLYSYTPIGLGKEKLHFLIMPKEHRKTCEELTASEYSEAMELSQKLVRFYAECGYPTAYLFNKSGAEAGQTVMHWHQHVVFTARKTEELYGKLVVLKNMALGASPLSPKALESRVLALREELKEAFREI